MLTQQEAQAIDASNQIHVANVTAVIHLLTEKGIITREEFATARTQCLAKLDQMYAAKKEEAEKTLDLFNELFGGIIK